MKNKYLLLISVLLLAFAGCKKDEENTIKSISLDKTTLSLHYNKTYSFLVSCQPESAKTPKFIWTSGNENVAKIDSIGKLTAYRIGNTTITVKVNNLISTCLVTVEPYSNLCIEPILNYGANKAAIKSGETRILNYENENGLIFTGENGSLRSCVYVFENNKMTSAALLFKNEIETFAEATTFLKERYTYLGIEDGVMYYTDKTSTVAQSYSTTLGFYAIYIPYSSTKIAQLKYSLNQITERLCKAIEEKR